MPPLDVDHFPERLRERIRPLDDRPAVEGDFVLYWMHHALRAHDNPALAVALEASRALDKPVLVYQGLGGGHRYDSDRHHTFILEGARDVARELGEAGIRYAFHLGAAGGPSPLRELCERAALVVAEDFPAPPFPRWTRQLAERARAPMWLVDTACIVPMKRLDRPQDRAFRFRRRIEQDVTPRLAASWDPPQPHHLPYAGELPFEPIDLAHADIAELCARCPIDHGVGPVPHTRGGSRAGYARWETFREVGLRRYARLRNDAAVEPPLGVSRMSPYLHYGMVSPFRLGRDAKGTPGRGADKFLDELVVWRELAHNLCFHRSDVDELSILPPWARQTLLDHANDPRPRIFSWEELARAKTDNALWDAAQRSLLIHGELHNNLRMTWGKAVLSWTRSPEAALRMLLDLNHRFALDGSDPNSYGGILWCLGLFDRPFPPERPILGTVRARPIDQHVDRLDLDAYRRRVDRPSRHEPPKVAVIGGGIAGLTLARTLRDHAFDVRVFDKGRRPGGRSATRRAERASYDHGAQYFTARDERFRRYVDSWVAQGVVAEWPLRLAELRRGETVAKPRQEPRFVGVPGMSALCHHLGRDVAVAYDQRIASIARRGESWELSKESGEVVGSFDVLWLATPAPQAAALLGTVAPALAERLGAVEMAPCWSVMVSFTEAVDLPIDGAFVSDSPLSWVARDGNKPGRSTDGLDTWVLHASAEWSREHLDDDDDDVIDALLSAAWEAFGRPARPPVEAIAHRWRYAIAPDALAEGCLWDPELRIGACGDWCHGSRVEGAFLSGSAAAGRVLGMPCEDGAVTSLSDPQGRLFDDRPLASSDR